MIPLENISPTFAQFRNDLLKCKTKEEKEKMIQAIKNWKYVWIAEAIKEDINKYNRKEKAKALLYEWMAIEITNNNRI